MENSSPRHNTIASRNRFSGIGIHSSLMNRQDLNASQKLIAALVAGICNASNQCECRATNKRIAEMTGLSCSTVAHAVCDLIKKGDFTVYGGRKRKLKTKIKPWDGAQSRTGSAPGLWVPREILELPRMSAEKKLHLSLFYNLRRGGAKVHSLIDEPYLVTMSDGTIDNYPDDFSGIHFQNANKASTYLGIGVQTIRDHREEWFKNGILERIESDNNLGDGYRMSHWFFDKLRGKCRPNLTTKTTEIAC